MTARLTAAAAPLKFDDGTSYQFSPLTDKDMDELDEWLQARLIENARNSLDDKMTQAERDETMSLAMRESLTVSFVTGQGARMLSTLPGMVRLCWQSIKKCHPNVTEAQLREKLLKPGNLDSVNDAFEKVNSLNERSAPSKNRRRAKR